MITWNDINIQDILPCVSQEKPWYQLFVNSYELQNENGDLSRPTHVSANHSSNHSWFFSEHNEQRWQTVSPDNYHDDSESTVFSKANRRCVKRTQGLTDVRSHSSGRSDRPGACVRCSLSVYPAGLRSLWSVNMNALLLPHKQTSQRTFSVKCSFQEQKQKHTLCVFSIQLLLVDSWRGDRGW